MAKLLGECFCQQSDGSFLCIVKQSAQVYEYRKSGKTAYKKLQPGGNVCWLTETGEQCCVPIWNVYCYKMSIELNNIYSHILLARKRCEENRTKNIPMPYQIRLFGYVRGLNIFVDHRIFEIVSLYLNCFWYKIVLLYWIL